MFIRSITNATWMHRNSARLICRVSSNERSVRAAISTTCLTEFKHGLTRSNFSHCDRRASSTKRTTRRYDPYDALRREEEVLREQDEQQKLSAWLLSHDKTEETAEKKTQSGHKPSSDNLKQPAQGLENVRETTENLSANNQSDQILSSDNLQNALKVFERNFSPLMSTRVAQEEYDNFEPSPKPRRRLDLFDKFFQGKETHTSLAAWKKYGDESSLDVAAAETTSVGNSVSDSRSNSFYKALHGAFFDKKDAMLAFHSSLNDLYQLRRIYKDDYDVAIQVVRSGDVTQITTRIEGWRESREVQPIVSLLIGSALSSLSEAFKVYSALGLCRDEFNIRTSFLHLLYGLHKRTFDEQPEFVRELDGKLGELRNPDVWPDHTMKLDFAMLLRERLDDTQLHKFIRKVDIKYKNLSPYQCVSYASLCLHKDWTKSAFSLLRKLRPEILKTPGEAVISVIGRLIKNDTVVDGPGGSNLQFLSVLLRKGLMMNGLLYSIVIERLLELEHTSVAWDVFHHLQQGEYDIEPRTYLLLLRHSYSAKDEKGVNEIMSEMHKQKALYTNPYLLSCAMNVVRNVCFSYQRMDAPECLSHLLALYDRAYTRAPLIRLGIVNELGPRELAEDLPEPTTYMLCFTVWAYILCHRHIPTALKIWERIHQRIQKGDTSIVECMTMDFLYNAYILLYRRSAKTLPHALEIFQYMLEKRWCLPSERTWGIMIYGFMRHGQRAEARQLMDLMFAHGFSKKDFDPLHLPEGFTSEDVEKIASADIDELLMPDGSDPLQSPLVEDDVFSERSGRVINNLRREQKEDGKEQESDHGFSLQGPYARLVTT